MINYHDGCKQTTSLDSDWYLEDSDGSRRFIKFCPDCGINLMDDSDDDSVEDQYLDFDDD